MMMTGCCSHFEEVAARQFTEKIASRDLADYRRKGPSLTTRLMRDALLGAGAGTGSLLDVGSGVGALTFELLKGGMERATMVEASSAYLSAAAEEATRRHCETAIEFVHGDFVDAGSRLSKATVVSLDRVVCCYPHCEPLLKEAAAHAEGYVALSYPKQRWYVRLTIALDNAMRRLKGSRFQVVVHPEALIDNVLHQSGFSRLTRRGSLVWRVDVYRRSEFGRTRPD